MAAPIDLLLHGGAADASGEAGLQAFLSGPGGQQAFAVTPPAELQQAYGAWRNRFLAHHGSGAIPAHALDHYTGQLLALLRQWLESSQWQGLQQALGRDQAAALRLRFQHTPPWLERLPWELLPLQRPIWRLADPNPALPPAGSRPGVRHRQPRLLLLVGEESGLSLQAEIDRLDQLWRQGRIRLMVLRGSACNPSAIRQALADPAGWDGLLFLGHSDADAQAGGRLNLGDGSWLTAQALESDLRQAAGAGLALVLLSSCSGLDLARSAVAAGIQWAVCFREPVPCAAAALAFCSLLQALEGGASLEQSAAAARGELEQSGPASTHLLLSLVGAPQAPPLQLPLRRRRQLVLRLAHSQPRQAMAAVVAVAIALAAEVVPWNPISQGLLDHRLRLQREWRQLTGQLGPTTSPLPVLLLEPRRAYPALGVAPRPDQSHLSREALLRVLQRIQPQAVPRIGLDGVLDQPAIEPTATAELAALIRRQQRPELFAGYYGAASDGALAGALSRPLPLLQQAGLRAYDLAVGTPPCAGTAPCQRPVPLQLLAPIDAGSFAQHLSRAPQRYLPADAVLDWSLPWNILIRRIQPGELSGLRAPVLLVGSDGQLDPQRPDLFDPPAAIQPALEAWGLPSSSLPGALVQAVLAQSLNLGHWLRPASLAATTALASGLGVLLAAGQSRRRRQLLLLALITLAAIPLAFQWAVGGAILIPLTLPLVALWATTLLRRA
ncbi:CHAT domain-containing protein [Vulcanococcus limneticus]|uniref:CHAT domain-containing protein n=1 Tax=Vulcanococcus limneticus TaxID=2170428 RepID=UPI00398BEBA3